MEREELSLSIREYMRRHQDAASIAGYGAPAASTSTSAEDPRFELLRSVGEECQSEADLKALLEKKASFNVYDGFEPSGRMHIAQGVFKAINVDKCCRAGGTFIFWVADWFALMNDKMGGDLEKIKTVGKYLIEVWKATGMDMSRVVFKWAADEINNNAKQYWSQALDVARRSTLARIMKCCQIMGRKEGSLTAAQILYPIMQCTDIFFLKADICQLGVDQRKVNMLARDYCGLAGIKTKPVVLSHHMLYGLKAGQAKMSKSDPDSAIFMEDTPEDVERKIRNAYCPMTVDSAKVAAADEEEMQLVKDDLMNPCLDYLKYVLYSRDGFSFSAGGHQYSDFETAKQAFLGGQLSEKDLKDVLIREVNTLLDPVRKHFTTDESARELLAKITQWKKETLVAPTGVVRLELVSGESKPVFVVFAPLPTETIQLDIVFGVLHRLRAAPAGSRVILWLEDWTASALGRVGGSAACIQGFYELLLHGLRSLAPSLMQVVEIHWQGEAILSNPSNYWISTINAGRRCSVEDVRKALPSGETLEYASQVFAALMHVSDVFALIGTSATTLCCDAYHQAMHGLALQHCEMCSLPVPKVLGVETPKLRLLPDGEGVEADVNIMLTDKEMDLNRKVKKAFCEPGNNTFCPPIAVVAELLQFRSEFEITRKPENGGNNSYTDAVTLSKDFGGGAVHPGDLKPALTKALNELFDGLRAGLKDIDVLKKAQKDLEAYAKSTKKK